MNAGGAPAGRTRRGRAWWMITLIFGLGFGVGVAVTTVVGVRLVRKAIRETPAVGQSLGERRAARLGAQVERELELDPTQAAAVQAVLDRSAAQLRSIREETTERFAAELRQSTLEVAAVLPPEKRAAWRALVAERFERLGLPPPKN